MTLPARHRSSHLSLPLSLSLFFVRAKSVILRSRIRSVVKGITLKLVFPRHCLSASVRRYGAQVKGDCNILFYLSTRNKRSSAFLCARPFNGESSSGNRDRFNNKQHHGEMPFTCKRTANCREKYMQSSTINESPPLPPPQPRFSLHVVYPRAWIQFGS